VSDIIDEAKEYLGLFRLTWLNDKALVIISGLLIKINGMRSQSNMIWERAEGLERSAIVNATNAGLTIEAERQKIDFLSEALEQIALGQYSDHGCKDIASKALARFNDKRHHSKEIL
jgi:hypothetical protein